MEKVGITIVGAGIVGLSIAAEISKFKYSVCVIERHESFGRETSSRNSEVVHAGIYYPVESLKTRMCLEGNRLIYETCVNNNIPYKKLGKLVVAVDSSEIPDMEALFANAVQNGVRGLELLNKDGIRGVEPAIKADAAIYSKETGIVDSHSLMKYYAFKASGNGVSIAYKTEVRRVRKNNGSYEITVIDADDEEFVFLSDILINCAGLESDTIARAAGIDIDKAGYGLKYCKGQYFSLSVKKSNLVGRLVYPVPRPKSAGLGIHATPNLAAIVRLGPDDEYIDRENINYDVANAARTKFYDSAVKFLPFLEEKDLTPDTSGVRPKLQGPNESFRDFIIKEETGFGFPGLINLIGIESPGMTAAPAIARYVARMLR